MTPNVNIDKATLYEEDFCLWLETTAELLKNRQLENLDYDNLIEEIETMGRSERNSLKSNLVVVLMHLLKYKYQPQKRSKSWLSSIFEHRRRLIEAFKTSPSLKRYYQKVFDECYQYAVRQASIETGLPLEKFPNTSPFTTEETIDFDFLPQDN
ncbi:hypothetical protein cce_4259 [Crocosphaera subtropica ATCC 51142]|uniref:DUF29 domain-containing protein n=1 Tax=Crocosphaera subtropica (strain ATCC 51142 / BH68) TaxID=43989 RepID=B1WSM8_CROS5|nr:DUF29 domain-containing protein [Crocosphaera subtropica]ACB53607.1 hypothetical protein cce_4259 [Crocosphaera subtropica ATCC 51142]